MGSSGRVTLSSWTKQAFLMFRFGISITPIKFNITLTKPTSAEAKGSHEASKRQYHSIWAIAKLNNVHLKAYSDWTFSFDMSAFCLA